MSTQRVYAAAICLLCMALGDTGVCEVDGGDLPDAPWPYDGAASVNPEDLILSWSTVSGGPSYDVYLGTTPDGLVFQKNVTKPWWKPETAPARGRCCYWQVGTHLSGSAAVFGPVWRFTTLPPTPDDAGLLAWYAFDEGTGNSSPDLSGRGGDARLENMTWTDAGTPAVDGASVQSDGTGWGHFQIPASGQPSDRLTLAGWFRVRSQEKPAALWSLGSGQGSYASFVVQPAGGGPIMEIRSPGQSQPVTSQVKDPLPIDRWTHLAVAMDGPGQKITIYEDGAVVSTIKNVSGLTSVLSQAGDILLGASFSLDARLSGCTDDIRLYARALNAQEVARTMWGHPDSPWEPSPRQWAQTHVSVPAVLQWQGDDSATAYNLYTGTSSDSLSLTASGLTSAQHTLAQKPAAGQTLYWRVEAVRDGGFVLGPLWRFSVTSKSLDDVIADASPWWIDYTEHYRQIAPDVSLTDTDGRGHRFRDYRGRHLLVIVWAPWCSVCRTEMTALSSLRETMCEDRLAILTIANEADKADVLNFLVGHPEITFPMCTTKLSSLPAPFGQIYHVPAAFYIAPDGMLKLATVGSVSQATMEAILAAAWPAQ
ncbi:MAG: LamG-like jellyroll fold domain-containing protein [Solirubrobacterales bacterium]